MQFKAAVTPVRQGRAVHRLKGSDGSLQAGAGCVTPSWLVRVAIMGHLTQVDLSDHKSVAPVYGADGLPAPLVGWSLPAPLVGLKCFATAPHRQQNHNVIKMEGRKEGR